MKLAMAKPSMMSSSHDTDSRFRRRGGLCLPKPGRHSRPPPPGPRTASAAARATSRSEPEDSDVALGSARSTRRRCRSRSRWERDRRLCLNALLRLGPSIGCFFCFSFPPKHDQFETEGTFSLKSRSGQKAPETADEPPTPTPHRPSEEPLFKMALIVPVSII